MASELILNFSAADQLTVSFDGESSGTIGFRSPLTDEELQELRWYVESYAAQYMTTIDDDRAARVAVGLKRWGTELYRRSIGADVDGGTIGLFREFLACKDAGRVLTVQAVMPEILALPWELLHVPGGAYVFNEKPRISIRRNLAGMRGGRSPLKVMPKETLRLLMVVSRPSDAGFIDPRADGAAVLEAVEEFGKGRIEVEFLRPGTLKALEARLENEDLPAVDILHFDGHGTFDATGDGTGFLLFEKADGKKDLVAAERLGELLNQQGLGLVMLSACQSSMVAGEEATGSVAARLTQTGVPSVVAMSYSVLVATTRRLFGSFYQNLVLGKGVGESLDNARRQLLMNPGRGERVRNGSDRIELMLQDWFVPTLYQSGVDRGMVLNRLPNSGDVGSPLAPNSGDAGMENVFGEPIGGFFGRRRELWEIERAFVGGARRVTISGFGGQGKTALAIEVGRWLRRTGMFSAVCFVDYAAFQGVDAVAVAVSTIAAQLSLNLIDAGAVRSALCGSANQEVLVILDNLEDVGEEAARELLEVAIGWSQVGRVLITTRQGELGQVGYETRGSAVHRQLMLTGLGTVGYPDDAIDLCKALWAVPSMLGETVQPMPERSALVSVLEQVAFHPLSIKLVVEQLRLRRVAAVGQALERLLAAVPEGQSKDRCLIASLNLSLERLGMEEREWVKRLGVFVGGAMENNLLAITELTAEQWGALRRQLEAAGLVTAERLQNIGVPYLRFHPTLAPVLWSTLEPSQQSTLKQQHQERYYVLSTYLYNSDTPNPHETRDIARRELPNLMAAVRSALDSEDENAIEFVNNVNLFLMFFGMNRDRKQLTDRAEAIAGAVGSRSWFLSRGNTGEQLWAAGQLQTALDIFEEMLVELGEAVSYERCLTLGRIGRCYESAGQSDRAAGFHRQELGELGQLEQSDGVKRQMGTVQADLGDVLVQRGDYGSARSAYDASLAIAQELGDDRQQASVNGNLGTLALSEGNLSEAQERYQAAIVQFQRLGEPAVEAVFLHQLGRAYEEAKAWDAAQEAYRKSAEIREQQGDLAGAAGTWNQLAIVLQFTEKFQEAEAYYRKAIEADRKVGNAIGVSAMLSNLANFLLTQGDDRLSEARQLAEEALGMKRTIDPTAAQIWLIYNALAEIAIKQGDRSTARDYLRQSRQSYAAFAGSQYELQKWEDFIQCVMIALQDSSQLPQLEEQLQSRSANGWGDLVAAIRRILAGERSEDEVCLDLDCRSALIVGEVLKRIEKLELRG